MANTYKALSTVTVGAGGASTITFSNIPQTYTDLMVSLSVRTNRSFINDSLGLEVNGSTASRTGQVLYGDSNGTAATNTTSEIVYAGLNGNNGTANTFSNIMVYCPNYAGSNTKSFSADGVTENNASGAGASYQSINSWLWSNTSPVTSLTFTSATGNSFVQYSTATLYGVFNADVSSAPATPTIGTATAGNTEASITFTGVSNAASYTMTSTPSSITATGTSSPITVTGLTNNTAYTFKVKSNNPFGSSAESAASNSVTPFAPVLAFDSIATFTLGSPTANITFSSIPSTYTHLQIRCLTRTAGTPSDRDSFYMQINSDTGSNYAWHYLSGDGTSITAGGTTSTTQLVVGEQSANGYTSGMFSPFIIDILDYTNTNKFKTVRTYGGFDSNGTGNEKGVSSIRSGLWRSTSAISSITLFAGGGRNTVANAQFALYGIKSV